MVNLNLLPPQIKLKIAQAKKSANVFGICLIVVIFLVVLTVVLISLKGSLLQPNLEVTKQAIQSANADLGSFDKLQEEALFLNDRAQVAKKIEEKKPSWSQILQDLINDVPTTVQFTSLTADMDKSPNFVLQGNTTSEREIIKFKDKLESSAFFKDVAFKSSQTNSSPDQSGTLTFTLEFNLEQFSAKETK
jgi:Tfp pilus assembly protein PilN